MLLTDLLAHAGATELRAILVGGYHGTWIPAGALEGLRLSRASLQTVGASPGPASSTRSRRTCGAGPHRADHRVPGRRERAAVRPVPQRLPTLALLLAELASNRVDDALVTEIRRVTGLVDGRGSCRHPDGTAR